MHADITHLLCYSAYCASWSSHLPVSSAGRSSQLVSVEAPHLLGRTQGRGRELEAPSLPSSPDSQSPTAQSENITTHRKLHSETVNQSGQKLTITINCPMTRMILDKCWSYFEAKMLTDTANAQLVSRLNPFHQPVPHSQVHLRYACIFSLCLTFFSSLK